MVAISKISLRQNISGTPKVKIKWSWSPLPPNKPRWDCFT